MRRLLVACALAPDSVSSEPLSELFHPSALVRAVPRLDAEDNTTMWNDVSLRHRPIGRSADGWGRRIPPRGIQSRLSG